MATYSTRMPAYSALFLASGNTIEEGDKVVLPDTILRSLLDQFGQSPMPHPLIFQIRNDVIGRVSHCGVLEFTAQDEAAFLPSWMMENLMLSDGTEVTLTLTDLPKLTFVKLQPLQYAFTAIPNPKAALEETLQKFTALSRGDTILARYHHDDYLLQVTAVRPDTGSSEPPAGCVIDTTVEVDFDAPLEAAPDEDVVTVLEMDRQQVDHVKADHYKHYRVKLIEPTMGIRIAIESRTPSTHPDIYASTTTDRPTAVTSQFAGDVARPIVVFPSDPSFSSSWFYVAVHSFGVSSAFAITATQVDAPRSPPQGGNTLGQISSPSHDEVVAGSHRCENCMRQVPDASYTIHIIVCARNNWACPTCRRVLNVREKHLHSHCPRCDAVIASADHNKHMALFHAPIVCKCGESLDAMALADHQATSCQFRVQPCRWCSEAFPTNQLSGHETICCSKTQPCSSCGKPVVRRLVDVHNATEHGINPCLDASGNRNTIASLARRDRNQRANEIASTYGAANDEDIMNRAIAASLGGGDDEDAQFARAMAASLNQHSPYHDDGVVRPMSPPFNSVDADRELQSAIAASMEIDPETQRDIERAIVASLSEQHQD